MTHFINNNTGYYYLICRKINQKLVIAKFYNEISSFDKIDPKIKNYTLFHIVIIWGT